MPDGAAGHPERPEGVLCPQQALGCAAGGQRLNKLGDIGDWNRGWLHEEVEREVCWGENRILTHSAGNLEKEKWLNWTLTSLYIQKLKWI